VILLLDDSRVLLDGSALLISAALYLFFAAEAECEMNKQ